MAKTLSLTAPDDVFDSAVDALALKGNWAQNGDLTLGDAGKLDFAKGVLLDFIGACIHDWKMAEVREAINQQQQRAAEAIQAGNAAARSTVEMKIE